MASASIKLDESPRYVTAASAQQTNVLRLLTSENLRLLSLIHHHKPDGVGALCQLSGRAQPNVSRALASLVKVKLVKLVGARPKRPELVAQFIVIDLTKPPFEDGQATAP